MSIKTNLAKAAAIGAVLVTASAGLASAAVSSSSTNVYRSPSYSSHVVNHLYRGEHVRLTNRQGSWCEVSISGPDGWVKCSALGNYSLDRFRPGITFNFGFGFPSFSFHPMHTSQGQWWWWNHHTNTWWNNNNDSHNNDQHMHQ